jgi:hypothetical protein
MNKNERLDDHQKFKQLAALAMGKALTNNERMELDRHLRVCDSCRQVFDEYALISAEGMPFLATAYGFADDSEDWDDRPGRNRLLARVQDQDEASESLGFADPKADTLGMRPGFLRGTVLFPWVGAALGACALIALALASYHLGMRSQRSVRTNQTAESGNMDDLVSQKMASETLVALQTSRLQAQIIASQQESARLRDALAAAETRFAVLSGVKASREEELRRVSAERDQLANQLHDAEKEYQLLQTELTTLRNEHDRVLLHTTSLESKIDELTASVRDQDRKIRDDEQYLSSDRDIRELMGARKLYIADVFDVDSRSRTRKPFGRVFYTQNKSLIFYAFDLDHGPGVKNASAFQVWGEKDAESGEKTHATNLGILYMDSETNRRWVLRLDDPKQLAEIDAVFVTVEPHGGSQKPTGKPFLYALLRREANHP